MDNNQTDTAILTGGLRRVLFGAVLAGCGLAAAQIVAVNKLQQEIGNWAWTSEINAQREQLLSRTYSLLDGDEDVEMSDVLNSFEDLRRSIATFDGSADDGSVVKDFAALELEAHDLFVRAEEKRNALVLHQQATREDIDVLLDLSGSWATQLLAEEQEILRAAELLESRNREIDELKSLLTSVILSAQDLQQQVIAVERLIPTSSSEIMLSSVLLLDAGSLPNVCEPGEVETADRLCSPSVARVKYALEKLQTGGASEIPQNVNLTLMGIQGYIRAGQGRLASLTEEGSQVVAEMSEIRRRLASLNTLDSSLNRVNRILLDIKDVLDRQITNAGNLDTADRQMRSYISQIRLRMSGILNIAPTLESSPEFIFSSSERISDNWTAARTTMSERIGTLDRFDETMATLSSEIAAHADYVRRDTTLWVRIYASSFLLLAGALVASVAGFFWFARRRFMTPLARVTGTIVGLARGNLERPIVLQERAFGFDTLGRALEQLRMEMVERHRLTERTAEQQKIIEANLAELERSSKDMEWMAMHDPLTSLGNRRQAELDLETLTEGASSSNTDFCVMQIDIDRFKTINDALGHPAGDLVLKTVAHILTECSGPDAKCYRIGGDEFLVVFFGDMTNDEAAQMAHRIIKLIETPIDFKGHRCNVGASVGIAFGRDASFDAMQCVTRADLALYQVKKTGRGSFEFFTEELARMSSRRNDISDRLLAAIEQKEFTPFYQPQFDANTRELRGVEVLCRWHDSELGWIPPDEFLSVANDLNAVGAIDEILFEKVTLDLQELFQTGLSLPKVSFNITADRLLKSNLAQELSGRIGTHTKIALELLESMSLDNPTESIAWALENLREHGIDVEIDDFGSDRASLAGLMAISPQAMKIDRSIVTPIVYSPRHRDIVKKIIDIGAALNVEVVAEGVETEEHAEQLKLLGCDVLQGFGLAKPMPYAELAAFCARQNGAQGGTPTAVA